MTASTGPARTGSGHRLVVGLDGSPADRTTLTYALAAAARRGAGLQVLTVLPTGVAWAAGTYALDVPVEDEQRAAVEARIRGLVEEVLVEQRSAGAADGADVPVSVRVTEGHPAEVLIAASGDADLLLVGRRRRRPVRRALLGSVALHCVTHAACPVLIVPTTRSATAGPARVVAGVDGSACAEEALVLAMEEAGRLGADVEAVAAYTVVDYPLDLYKAGLPTGEQLRAQAEKTARQQADAALHRLLERQDGPGVLPSVEVVPVEGDAADVLVDRSRDAALLVVGSHGHGRIREVLLGSVALHCAISADCPVVVVRTTGTEQVPGRP